jgi:ribosomal-protein-alanine N-acetyltransferase
MSAEISIRAAVVEDAAEVLEIERNCAEAPHWSEAVWAQILSQYTQDAPLYRTPFGGSRRMCFVAEQEDEIAGFVVISVLSGSGVGDGVAEMESLAVREDARKRGVGRSLCLQAMLWAQTMGAGSMQLEVRSASVAAMALYRSLSFLEQGRRSGYYTDPKDDAVMMELALTQKDA